MSVEKKTLKWGSLGGVLQPWILEAINSIGFEFMTPVQASTIPLFSGNKDVVVEAVTGSGKTLAFVIPILNKISRLIHAQDAEDKFDNKKSPLLSVILAPTRELAHQIRNVVNSILEYLPDDLQQIKTQLVLGSLDSSRDNVEEFLSNKPNILIGTPGRMLEFLLSKKVKSNCVEVVVLDEADKLLDAGFEQDVVKVLKILPKQRRTGLFSATISSAGDSIYKAGMTNAVKVKVSSSKQSSAPKNLSLSYMLVDPSQKLSVMLHLLKTLDFSKSIVYFPTCQSVKYFYSLLQSIFKEEGIKLFSLHGQLQTKARLKTLNNFSEDMLDNSKCILMTTDVAARGIDVPSVDLVIQLDPPTDPDVFLHRCGRTGRANKAGTAIVMLNKNSREPEYVEFMKVKNVNLVEKIQPDVDNFHEELYKDVNKYILEDRARHESAIKSYVGFVRYYSKHAAASIFRLQNLEYIQIAKMYGLLRLPKMPETKYIPSNIMPDNGWLVHEFDYDNYAYADKQKEKSRIRDLKELERKKIEEGKRKQLLKIKNEAWSSKKDKKEQKSEKREKLKRKREEIEKQLLEEPSEDEETHVDWKDLVKQSKKQKNKELQGSFDGL